MNKKTMGIVGVFLVGIILGLVLSELSPIKLTNLTGASDASSKLKSLYELVNPGINVEIVKLDDVSGVYKVLFKATDAAGGVSYKEVYTTKDGKLLTENVIVVDQSITQLGKVRNFIDCLSGKNVVIAGIANQTATLLQFNALGGSYATKLYMSCDGTQAQQCVNAGITQVPATIYQGKGYAGVQPIQFFENLTSCKF